MLQVTKLKIAKYEALNLFDDCHRFRPITDMTWRGHSPPPLPHVKDCTILSLYVLCFVFLPMKQGTRGQSEGVWRSGVVMDKQIDREGRLEVKVTHVILFRPLGKGFRCFLWGKSRD